MDLLVDTRPVNGLTSTALCTLDSLMAGVESSEDVSSEAAWDEETRTTQDDAVVYGEAVLHLPVGP